MNSEGGLEAKAAPLVLGKTRHRSIRLVSPKNGSIPWSEGLAARVQGIFDERAKGRQIRKPVDSVPETLPEQKGGDARD